MAVYHREYDRFAGIDGARVCNARPFFTQLRLTERRQCEHAISDITHQYFMLPQVKVGQRLDSLSW